MVKFLILIAVFFGLPLYLFIKFIKGKAINQKNSSWKGKLINKEQSELEEEDSSYAKDTYTLFFETVEGNQVKINVPKNIYDDLNIGDKAEKGEGKLYPNKIG